MQIVQDFKQTVFFLNAIHSQFCDPMTSDNQIETSTKLKIDLKIIIRERGCVLLDHRLLVSCTLYQLQTISQAAFSHYRTCSRSSFYAGYYCCQAAGCLPLEIRQGVSRKMGSDL